MDFDTIEKLRRKYPQRLTRGRAIKLYCKELCSCGDYQSWANCTQKSCFLYPFRQGREETITETKKISKNGVCSQDSIKKDTPNPHLKPTLQGELNIPEKSGIDASNSQTKLGGFE